MSDITIAFSPETARKIQGGDTDALLRAIACLAEQWFRDATGQGLFFAHPLGLTRAAISADPTRLALAAAAYELSQTILLSPKGREACANLKFMEPANV